jgi:hypothetical protein
MPEALGQATVSGSEISYFFLHGISVVKLTILVQSRHQNCCTARRSRGGGRVRVVSTNPSLRGWHRHSGRHPGALRDTVLYDMKRSDATQSVDSRLWL